MNPIAKALDEINFALPAEVLEVAFRDDGVAAWRRAPISLNERIMLKVIRPRVLTDCNLIGGQTANISLEGLAAEYGDNFALVYVIPKTRTQNRSILSVLSVGYLPIAAAYGISGSSYGMPGIGGSNMVGQVSQRIMDSVSTIPAVSTAQADLVGENTVIIRDQQRVTSAYQLRCLLMNEENLNNINPRSYMEFSTLCVLAVKSYIYNKLIVRLDQAFLQSGQELGAMKSYIENLQDSEEMYQTFLRETWGKVAFMNDQMSYTSFIKTQISPGL